MISQLKNWTFTIRSQETGEIEILARDVCTEHSEWVHRQLGTSSESELQHFLDQLEVLAYIECSGGPDSRDDFGVGIE